MIITHLILIFLLTLRFLFQRIILTSRYENNGYYRRVSEDTNSVYQLDKYTKVFKNINLKCFKIFKIKFLKLNVSK